MQPARRIAAHEYEVRELIKWGLVRPKSIPFGASSALDLLLSRRSNAREIFFEHKATPGPHSPCSWCSTSRQPPQPLASLFSDETLALYKKLTMIIGSLAQPLRLYLILQLILREKKERSVLSTPTSATATGRGQDITARDWRATRVGRILPRPDLCGSSLTSGLLELLTLYKVPLNASQFVPLPRCCTYLQHL